MKIPTPEQVDELAVSYRDAQVAEFLGYAVQEMVKASANGCPLSFLVNGSRWDRRTLEIAVEKFNQQGWKAAIELVSNTTPMDFVRISPAPTKKSEPTSVRELYRPEPSRLHRLLTVNESAIRIAFSKRQIELLDVQETPGQFLVFLALHTPHDTALLTAKELFGKNPAYDTKPIVFYGRTLPQWSEVK
jgi:hypothetical protein